MNREPRVAFGPGPLSPARSVRSSQHSRSQHSRSYVGHVPVVQEFATLVASGAEPLDRALALIAATGRPEVDPDALVASLDELAVEVPADDAATLCRGLFTGLGFSGNSADYYDPDNSLLDRVLDRRTGIPITLAVLAMEVGRRRDVSLVGIGMPGHFLLRDVRDHDAFYDAFDSGRTLDRDGCRRVFSNLHGPTAQFSDTFLDPVSPVEIVLRVLNNLRAAHLRRGDRAGFASVLRLQAALPWAGVSERRQLAGVLAEQGHFIEAATLYEQLSTDDVGRSDQHRRAVERLRANLN